MAVSLSSKCRNKGRGASTKQNCFGTPITRFAYGTAAPRAVAVSLSSRKPKYRNKGRGASTKQNCFGTPITRFAYGAEIKAKAPPRKVYYIYINTKLLSILPTDVPK